MTKQKEKKTCCYKGYPLFIDHVVYPQIVNDITSQHLEKKPNWKIVLTIWQQNFHGTHQNILIRSEG